MLKPIFLQGGGLEAGTAGGGNWLLFGFAAAAAAVIDAGIVKLIHVSPAAGEAAKSIRESTDSTIRRRIWDSDLVYECRWA